jgi:hypothetical protein
VEDAAIFHTGMIEPPPDVRMSRSAHLWQWQSPAPSTRS